MFPLLTFGTVHTYRCSLENANFFLRFQNECASTRSVLASFSPRFRLSNQFSLSGKCFVWLFLDPPSITHIIHDRIVNETDVVLLNCTGDGNPLPSIRWTRLPDNITVSKVLNIIDKQDEGLYRCTAENGVGNAATKDVNITVLCKSNS